MTKSDLQKVEEHAFMMFVSAVNNREREWESDNLSALKQRDRSAILKVYKSIWPIVEYNRKTGICVCSFRLVSDPVEVLDAWLNEE